MKLQTEPYSLTQYLDAGCLTLVRDGKLDAIGAGIHAVSQGMPCNGCFMANTGCHALAKLRKHGAPLRSSAQPTETVRAEAARRGISISEVRRQRQESATATP